MFFMIVRDINTMDGAGVLELMNYIKSGYYIPSIGT